MSLALGDVVPRVIIQSLHVRVGEFKSHLAKRFLQQYRHEMDQADRPYAFFLRTKAACLQSWYNWNVRTSGENGRS